MFRHFYQIQPKLLAQFFFLLVNLCQKDEKKTFSFLWLTSKKKKCIYHYNAYSSSIYYVLNKYIPFRAQLTRRIRYTKMTIFFFNFFFLECTQLFIQYWIFLTSRNQLNCFFFSLSRSTKIQYLICFPWTWHVLVSFKKLNDDNYEYRTQIHGTKWLNMLNCRTVWVSIIKYTGSDTLLFIETSF